LKLNLLLFADQDRHCRPKVTNHGSDRPESSAGQPRRDNPSERLGGNTSGIEFPVTHDKADEAIDANPASRAVT
jgi:hypothetical protein